MKFNEKDIGSNLMYAITSGLYSKDVSTIREYFQNAYDPPALATEININFENNGINCSIKDNGAGMDEDGLRRALGVGIYTKNKESEGIESEGIFGIGIWSGIAVCNRLVIITKKKGSAEKLRIEIDAKAIREDSTNNVKLTDFLSERTGEIEHLDAKTEIDQSYTIVRLENILEIHRKARNKIKAFNEEGLIEFASKNLPVPIDPNFEYAKKIEDEIDKQYIREVNLTIGGKRIYRHSGLKDHVRNPVIRTFTASVIGEDGTEKEIPVVKVWVSLNKEYITLNENLRGIDFRHNGFKIESWDSVRSTKSGSFTERWVGEIHVIHPNLLRPTAGRDAFQPVPWREEIDTKISKMLSELQSINSYVSVGISSLNKETDKLSSPDLTKTKKQEIIRKVIDKNMNVSPKGIEDIPEYGSLINELKKEQEEAKTKFNKVKNEIESQTVDDQQSPLEFKKALSSIPTNRKVSDIMGTLMEKKYLGETKVDPFIALKEQIEEKTHKSYKSFTVAVDAIGTELTLYPKSDHREENDKKLVKFLKDANEIFRNLFEHASKKTNSWFKESKNVDKLKAGLVGLIGLISLIIDELVPLP